MTNVSEKQTSGGRVAMIGAGQMGSALARAVKAGGCTVTAWNRTTARAEQLAAYGIKAATTVLEAVQQADLILVCVMDTAQTLALLSAPGVEEALAGKTLVNYTTGTPANADAMSTWSEGKGFAYLDGAIMCLPSEIGHPHALLVHSGNAEGYARHREALSMLGGQASYVDGPSRGARVIDSALLTFFYGSVMSMCQSALLADAYGLSLPQLIPFIERFLPTVVKTIQSSKGMAEKGDYAGTDANLNLHYENGLLTPFGLAKDAGIRTDLYVALDKMMGYGIAQGRGNEELPVVFDALKKAKGHD